MECGSPAVKRRREQKNQQEKTNGRGNAAGSAASLDPGGLCHRTSRPSDSDLGDGTLASPWKETLWAEGENRQKHQVTGQNLVARIDLRSERLGNPKDHPSSQRSP
jgi:hypothetical protein